MLYNYSFIDNSKNAVVGDKIKFRVSVGLETSEFEGIVSYDVNRKVRVLTSIKWFDFDDIIDWYVIEPGPFHDYSSLNDYYNLKHTAEEPDYDFTRYSAYNLKDDNKSSETFYYRFGESACDVFQRWSEQLNKLSSEIKKLKKKVNR